MTLTVGSLFSGIGGIDLGLERAGMRVVWQVEIDPWCRRVLEKHWPDVERFEDVRSVGSYNLGSVDVIAGGFPCTDISVANVEGLGLAGEQSGLWFEMQRVIGELRPRYVFVENVSALLVRGLGDVLGGLAALGYDAEWDCIPAAAFGAPHRRDRLFLVAYAERARLQGRGGGEVLRCEPQSSSAQLGNRDVRCGGWWAAHSPDLRVGDGLPLRLVRRVVRGTGNAVVPEAVEWIGRRIVEAEAGLAKQ